MSKGYFVTATGTDVGKTFITALLVKKWRDCGIDAGYYKAALSGAELRDGRRVPRDHLPDRGQQKGPYDGHDLRQRPWHDG